MLQCRSDGGIGHRSYRAGRGATLAREARRDSALAVVGVVLAVYVSSLAVAMSLDRDVSYFAFVGQAFLDRSAASAAIESNAETASGNAGYDGQFSLFIAQDPLRAHGYVDNPSYRYGRILYPMTARAASTALVWAFRRRSSH